MQISVRGDIDKAIKELSEAQRRHVPFAVSLAMKNTAYEVKAAQEHEIRDVYDRPTPFTQRGVEVVLPKGKYPQAKVYLRTSSRRGTAQAKYLAPTVKGGQRGPKPYERALRAANILPEGMFTVPGSGAKMDAYGNMSRAQIVQILAYFKAFPVANVQRNMSDKRKAALAKGSKKQRGMSYFVGAPGKGPLGVWARYAFGGLGTAVKPVMIFVSSARYQKMYPFHDVGRRVVARRFTPNFQAALSQALATAR